MRRWAVRLTAIVIVLVLVGASPALGLAQPNSFYTYYAPGGWTYNAPANLTYNCLAYALGITNQWIWPPYWGYYASETEVDLYMTTFCGKTKCTSAQSPSIIAYGYSGDTRHFAKVSSSTRTIAKWGQLERFTHPWYPYRYGQSDPLTYGAGRLFYK